MNPGQSTPPTAVLVRTAGTNCDAELARAFELAGARVELHHVDRLAQDPAPIARADLLGFPGGFSYGDDIASGRILAARLRERLWTPLRDAANRGALMIGICNGFQVLTQLGLLPGSDDGHVAESPSEPTISLADNEAGRFIDRWTAITSDPSSPCIWTRGLDQYDPDTMTLPIAHGEGRLVVSSEAVRTSLVQGARVALRYAEPVNGSVDDIAGVCDATGRIFGLMPHPERYLEWNRHPFWTRLGAQDGDTPGLRIFQNAVEHAAANLPTAAAAN